MVDWSLLRSPDIVGNALASFKQGQQDRGMRQAGQALQGGDYGGAQNALYGAGMVDEGLALGNQQYQRQRDQMQDARLVKTDERETQKAQLEMAVKRAGVLANVAEGLKRLPLDQRQAAFERQAQQLTALGLPADFLAQAAGAPKDDANLDSFITALGGEVEKAKYQFINLGSGGVARGNETTGDFTTLRAPAPEYKAFDATDNVYQVGGESTPGQPAAPALDFASIDQMVQSEFGARVTSSTRTPQRNAEVKGQPDSYHLTGQARDYSIPQGMTAQQFAAQLQARVGPQYEVIAEPARNHVHIEPAPGVVRGRTGGMRLIQQGRPKGTGRPATAEEKAAYGLPPDYPAQITDDGEFKPITGAESIVKRDEKTDGKALAQESRVQQAAFINGTVDEALSKLGRGEAGIVGSTMAGVPGTKAYDLAQTLQTIKANLGFQELAAMRAASPTGGALGAIAVQELQALQATVASLDQGQSEAQLRANLKKVQRHYQRWMDAVEGKASAQPARQPASGSQGSQGRQPARTAPRVNSDADYNRLRPGTVFIDPNGQQRRKPG